MGDPKEDSAASELAGITSDGKTPAEENPWYVLATIAGKLSSAGLDLDLEQKNRAYWNAWAGQHLSAEDKAEIKNASGKSLFEDTPEWSEVEAEVTEAFTKRLPGLDLPDPAVTVDFEDVAFSAPVSFDRFYFSATADFENATFSENADFNDATFSEYASFISAGFSGPVEFVRTKFSGRADFTDASFDAPCNFREAEFEVAYPDREGTLLHAKTNISAEDDFWPKPGKQKPDPERKHLLQTDKQAVQSCAHLRQNMAAQGLPEAAHFFFRREMTHRSRISRRWERPSIPFIAVLNMAMAFGNPLRG